MTKVMRIKHQALILAITVVLLLLSGCGKGTPTTAVLLQTATGVMTPHPNSYARAFSVSRTV